VDTLEAAVRAFRRAASTHEKRRKELAAAIVADAQAGVKQTEICRITGYTRERIRQIVRQAEQDR
jgi:predicted transcriptional regulator